MHSVRLVIGLLLAVHAMLFTAETQILDVCIKVRLDQSFRRDKVPADELEKLGRFCDIEAMPFDTYYRVSSALYDDYFDSQQLVEMKRNLIKQVPIMVEKDLNSFDCNVSMLLKEYKFPRYLSKTVIQKLELLQKNNKPFEHVIYKNKQAKKNLILRYWIDCQKNKEESPTPFITSSEDEHTVQDQSFVTRNTVIDLLNFFVMYASSGINQ